MAYPVGFELLREHFGDLPQWQDVRLEFYSKTTFFASEFRHVLSSGAPYCVLSVEHETINIALGWHINVYPVFRELKSVARATLIQSAFTPLHDFMARARVHRHYRNKAEAIFDPLASTCSVKVDFPP